MKGTGKAKIIFQPSGRRGEVDKGVTIIEASRQLGVDIESLCEISLDDTEPPGRHTQLR